MIEQQMYSVGMYYVTRHYGGPEEGGWWYDRHEFVRTVQKNYDNKKAALSAARRLNREARTLRLQPHGNYQGRYSVANNRDTVFYAEDAPGEHDDTDEPRPHYE